MNEEIIKAMLYHNFQVWHKRNYPEDEPETKIQVLRYLGYFGVNRRGR